MAFSLFGFLFAYFIQRLQAFCPLNPQNFGAEQRRPPTWPSTPPSAFVTNTNWQAYSGESTLSYFVQMAALTVQNFVSAGGRRGDRRRADARLRAAAKQDHRQFLGRYDARHSVRVSSTLAPGRFGFELSGRDPESARIHQGSNRGRRRADHRARARGFPGSDQNDRHERRRISEREFRASIRKSHPSDEFFPDAHDLSRFPPD